MVDYVVELLKHDMKTACLETQNVQIFVKKIYPFDLSLSQKFEVIDGELFFNGEKTTFNINTINAHYEEFSDFIFLKATTH